MLKKSLLLSGLLALITACDSPTVNDGPYNTSRPTPPPPVPDYTPQWSFDTVEGIEAWTVEWNKPGSSNAQDSEKEWHETQYALEIQPNWGGLSVAKLDSVTAYGTLEEPVNLEYGTIYMSLYYPSEHLGNPWGTGPYWGQSAHHLGTQYLVIDSSGNRAKLDTGNGSDWINSFDIGSSKWQRTDSDARKVGKEQYGSNTEGIWFDLKIESGITYFEDDDNASAFDLTSVVSVGVVMNYALEKPDNAGFDATDAPAHTETGASDKWIYIDDVAVVPYVGEPPVVTVEPPPALEELPEFGLPIYRDSLESGFNSSWPGVGGSWDWASEYGVKSGLTSIALTYDTAGAIYKIGGPDETLDLSTVATFDFSAWVGAKSGEGTTKLFVSMCDCDDGVEVVLNDDEWNNISIPVSDFGKDALYGALRIKNNSSGSRVIYLDDVGFDKVPDVSAPTFALPVYFDNETETGFSKWDGWDGVYDFASTTKYETGSTAMELAYDGGWGSMQIGVSDVDVSGHAAFHFSAYMPEGGDETAILLIQICGGGIGCEDNDGAQVTVTAGEWTQFTLPLSSFTQLLAADPAVNTAINEIRIKNNSDASKTIYVDSIGFDANYSPEFLIPTYSDSIGAGFTKYDGWGGAYDFVSEVMPQSGMYSIEAAYDGGYGAIQFGVSSVDVSAVTSFNLSVYLPAGTADSTLLIQLCSKDADEETVGCGDNDGVQAVAIEGQWTNFELPIADFPEILSGLLTELRIKNYSGDSKTLYIDNVGFDQQPLTVLDLPVFLDSVETGFSKWDGWGGTYDLEQSDSLYHGYKTAHFAYDGGWGSMQFGASDVNITGMSTFNFSAVAAEGTGSTTLMIQFCGKDATETDIGCGDNDGVQATITDAGWQSISLNVSDFIALEGGVLKEIRIKNYTDASKAIYFDNIGFKK